MTHIEIEATAPLPHRCLVWRNSSCGPIDWARPMTERERKAWLRQLHAFDGQHKRDRGPQGCIGRIGFNVIGALLFLQRSDGQLSPSKARIAEAAGVCERTAHDALVRLRDRGVIGWQRRCKIGIAFPLVQDTSAYYLKPSSEWRGYRPPGASMVPPLPHPTAWGACPPHPAPIDLWSQARKAGAGVEAQVEALQADPTDRLAVALGGLRRAMDASLRDGKVCRETYPGFILKRENPPDSVPG